MAKFNSVSESGPKKITSALFGFIWFNVFFNYQNTSDWKKKFAEKLGRWIIEQLIVMQLQFKFHLILTSNKVVIKENSIFSNSGHLELMMPGAFRHNFDRGPAKDNHSQACFNFSQQFQRRRNKWDVRMTCDTWWQKLTWPVGWTTASSFHYKWLVSNQTCELPCTLTYTKNWIKLFPWQKCWLKSK